MLHLRLVVPDGACRAVEDYLVQDERTTNVVVLPGAARDPAGDVVTCDVAREGASDVLARVRELGLDDRGTVAIEEVVASPSPQARRAERAAPGSPDDGVVWDVVTDAAYDGARSSWTYYAFLSLATTIAAVAVVLDSPILVVGAMVVGPEFSVVSAVALGLVLRERRLVLGGCRLLVLGFAVAIAITTALSLVAAAAGWVDAGSLTAPRPQTGFIWTPDRWSFVVALLAGTAGTLSLTAGRSNALVGVFISVTTVPAAGNLALALALAVPHEIGGAAAQLGINLAGMVLAGSVTLLVQRALWARLRRPRRGPGADVSPGPAAP
ncbi:DUF389 domain-containing protein [Angustibacter peucedani]